MRKIINQNGVQILLGGREYADNGKPSQAAVRIINGDVDQAIQKIQQLESKHGLQEIEHVRTAHI